MQFSSFFLSRLAMPLKIFALFLFVVLLMVIYVVINFAAANWVTQQNWGRIERVYKFKQRQMARLFASPKILIASAAITVFLLYAMSELRVSTALWWSAFVMLCMGLLPIWICCLVLEKIFKIADVTRSVVNRFGFYIVIGFLLWFARAAISDEINEIFPFDPGTMPLALTAGVFLILAGLGSLPTGLVMLLLEVLCILVIFDRVSRKKTSLRHLILGLFPLAFFVGLAVSSSTFSRIGLSELRTLLVARIAFEYDFNGHYQCYGVENGKKMPLKDEEKVLFIGTSQERGIAATAKPLPHKPANQFKKEEVKGLYPVDFHSVVCNQP
jgi:hypothetical protein